MRKLILFVSVVAVTVLGATAAGAADYPVNTGGLEVTQNGVAVSSVAAGSTVTVSGTGFAPGASVQVTIASTPTLLTTTTATGAGAISAAVTIPKDIAEGSHTLSATGADPGGGTLVLSKTITVTNATSAGTGSGSLFGMATTGANIAGLVAVAIAVIALGALFVTVTRRRSAALDEQS